MDSVEYSGLRQYLLRTKSRNNRVHRELWECNGATYFTYRKYLNHVREFGFPDEQALGSLPLAVFLRKLPPGGPELLSPKQGGGPIRRLPAVFSFSGVRHILDNCTAPISVLSFGNLTSELLAYGSMDGSVWLATLAHVPIIKKLSGVHTREVRGLDWSRDNSWLVTSSMDSSVCLWDVVKGSCSRQFTAPAAATCCRFHPINQNLLFVGSGGGIILFNMSTGTKILSQSLATGVSQPEVTAMACSNTSVFVGTHCGSIHVFRCEMNPSAAQRIIAGYVWSHPGGKDSPVVSIQWQGYTTSVKGPALLVMYLDSTVAIFKVFDGASCRLEFYVKATVPPAARMIRAVWCPSTSIDEPQCIATGGEDTNVHILDIHKVKGQALTINKLQAHRAPVVDVSWSYDESGLASGDCEGTVIVWKREDSAVSSRRSSTV